MTLAYPEPLPEVPADQPAKQTEPPYELGEHLWKRYPYYSKEFADEVCERFGKHMDWWQNTAYARCVYAAYRAYYNLDPAGGDMPEISITEAGESGEFLALRLNNYRTYLKRQNAMVTAEPPQWEPQARTAESEAAEQVTMARNLCDYALTAGLMKQLRDQFEMSKPCAASFLVLGWDPNAGMNGSGWFTADVEAPWEMAQEKVRNYEHVTHWIWRTFESKWDWVARFADVKPEQARKIAALDQSQDQFSRFFMQEDEESFVGTDGDRIAVLNVFIKPTIACPEGRLAKITSDGIYLHDGASPFGDEVPITRLCPAEMAGTAIPYSDSWSLLAPAEAMNAIVSAIVTRFDMFAIPNITYTTGTEFVPSDISGANALEYPNGYEKPATLDQLQIPPEMPGTYGMLDKIMEVFSGINSVSKGQPAENVSSGAMAALLQSMSIQYNSTDEIAWVSNLERVGTLIVKIFQAMASEDVIVAIVGEDKRHTVRQFKGKQIGDILSVSVKAGSPITRTPGFRLDAANNLLQNGAVGTPAEYLSMVTTGTSEPEYNSQTADLRISRAENEQMRRGKPVPVLWYDNDLVHFREHAAELSNPEVRANMQLYQLIKQHQDAHVAQWSTKSREAPDVCAAQGMPPLMASYAVGQQGREMEAMAAGLPPPAPVPPPGPPPQQLKQHGTEGPAKSQPGPAPAPKGQEPSQGAPKQPKPAKSPTGEPVT